MRTIISKKMFKTIEKHTNSSKECVQIVAGDSNAELGSGNGVERASVGPHTLNEGNKRGDWMRQWLMMENFTALNTMYRKATRKQTIHRSLEGAERQIDNKLIKRRHPRFSQDAEANDIIHMGIDHRCVMATFVINAQ